MGLDIMLNILDIIRKFFKKDRVLEQTRIMMTPNKIEDQDKIFLLESEMSKLQLENDIFYKDPYFELYRKEEL